MENRKAQKELFGKRKNTMAKHEVICFKCKQKFDTNQIQAVKIGARRYGHAACYPDNVEFVPMEGPKLTPEEKELLDYIAEKYKDKANWPMIKKQIKRFHDDLHYTYSGMLKSLTYFFEIQHGTLENSNGGVGIIEFVYDKAKQHYFQIYLAQHQNEDKTFIVKVKEYLIPLPKSKGLKRKEIRWGEDE